MDRYTKRKRVETALNHIEPDRVPCDITIAPDAYDKLCKKLGEKFEPYTWDDWNHAYPSVEVLEKLGIDIYHVDIGTDPEGFTIESTVFKDAWGVTKRRIDSEKGFIYCLDDTPLSYANTTAEIEAWPWPKPEQVVNLTDNLVSEIKHLYNNTEFALTATFGGNLQERSHFLIGMDNWLINFYDNPDLNHALFSKILGIQMQVDQMVIEKIGEYLTYFRFNGEDVGTQTGPLYSPEQFEKYTRPYLEKEWKNAKELFHKKNPDGKIAIHSCGSVDKFIPKFIEMGADILNPVQPNVAGMDTEIIGQEYGDQICFHGAVNTQDVLERGTREIVREEVRKRIRDLGVGGGFLIAPSHNVQVSAPVENVLTMYEAVREFGVYPLT